MKIWEQLDWKDKLLLVFVITITLLYFFGLVKFFMAAQKPITEYKLKNVSIIVGNEYQEGFNKLCFSINNTNYYLYYKVLNATMIPREIENGEIIYCTGDEISITNSSSSKVSIWWQITNMWR